MLGPEVEAVPHRELHQVFQAVVDEEVCCGVIPIENSLGGSIDGTYGELWKTPLSIEAELQIEINQCLMAPPGVTLEEIERVYSHPQALAQSARFLSRHPDWEVHAVYDTAGAARMVSEIGGPVAAVASSRAAEIYGLDLVREKIQDDVSNHTRFIRVGRWQQGPTGKDKTSLIFTLKDVPGALFKAVAAFALRDVNLTKLQSRPSRERAWHYQFFVDLLGHREDLEVKRALVHLEELTTVLKVLGSYPQRS
jgi:prephenate dehydratase